jgi:Glycosyl hydrolases family 18/Fibronectin type III domain
MSYHRLSSLFVAVLAAGSLVLPACGAAPVSIARNAVAHANLGTARTGEAPPSIMAQAADLAAQPPSRALLNAGVAGSLGTPRAVTLSASPNKLQREVFGFVNAGNLGDPSIGYPSWNMSLLSTVAFFDLQVNSGDGNLVTNTTGWYVYHSSTMTSFVSAAHASGTRVIVSLNLHGTGPVCNGLQPANAQNTINQIVAQVHSAGIDGVNINYEAENVVCPNGQTSRGMMTAFMANLRNAMPTGYIAIDTYSGSAEDNLEFFDITGLQPYVDAFFLMTYDMDEANYSEAPLNCTSYCFNPISPLNTYRFNVTKSIQQYTALVPRSKVIIGQPYYGRDGCVGSPVGPAHQNLYPGFSLNTPTYYWASTRATTAGFHDLVTHRDPSDGVSEWDTYGEYGVCTHEQYWDDIVSLSAKYDAVNQYDLRGVGLFTLDYAGGAPAVWSILATHFSQIPGAPGDVSACAGNASATVSWTPAPTSGGPVTSYVVKADPGGATATVAATARIAIVSGLAPGTAYTFTVNGVNSSGLGVGSSTGSVTPASTAPTSSSYFSWYDRASPGAAVDTIHVTNTGTATSSGCVTIAGTAVVPFSVDPAQDSFVSFPVGTIGGPVDVSVNSGPSVLAVGRSWYYHSLSETLARPASAAAMVQYFPWYDLASPGMRAETIHITNVSGAAATGTITLNGAAPLSFNVADGQEAYLAFPSGTIGGPVTVTSSGPVLAMLRGWYYNSLSEMPALTATDAGTTLYMPWYDLASSGMRADTIHISNVGGATATGTIALAGAASLNFSVTSGHDAYYAFPSGTIGGPVTINSSQSVLASLRGWYYQSLSESAARPSGAAATKQTFDWYDLASPGMNADTIHITNVSGASATGTISILGATPISFTVANGQDSYFEFPSGTRTGPVTISSSQPVIATLRAWFYQSLSEVPGS